MDYKTYSSLTRTQVGGDHYSKLKMQPIDYILANGFNYHEGAVLKYLTRHKDKGKKQDLEKAIHYLQMMIQSYEQLYPVSQLPPQQRAYEETFSAFSAVKKALESSYNEKTEEVPCPACSEAPPSPGDWR